MNRHSAAFFDLDRTLISGSSVFVLGVAAWRQKLVPSHQFVRDAASAIAFRLKGASDDLKDKFLKNLSERAAGMIREDLEIMGPVKLSEVEAAQQNIVKTVRRLEGEGRIAISRGGGDEFI